MNQNFQTKAYGACLILFTFNIIFTFSAHGQLPPNPEQDIIQLRQGALLVKLRSYQSKIKFIHDALQSPKCGPACKESYEKLLLRTLQERDSFNIPFRYWINRVFSFCPVYFFYDCDYSALRQSGFKGKFWLNDHLERDSSIAFPDTSYFLILCFDHSAEQNQHVMLFENRQGLSLPKPFPYLREYHAKTLLVPLTHKKSKYHYTAFILADLLNKKLFNYYEKVYKKQWRNKLYQSYLLEHPK